MPIKLIDSIINFDLGPGHVTFWTLSTGSENTAQDLGDRLRATEGRFMMTAVADVESVAATGSTGRALTRHQAVSVILVPCPDSVTRCSFAKNFSKMPKSTVK